MLLAFLGLAAPVFGWGLALPAQGASDVHAELNARARGLADEAMQRALEERISKESEAWELESVGSGTVQPLKTWLSRSGHYCRSFEERIRLVSGEERVQRAIGCREDGGIWKRVRQ